MKKKKIEVDSNIFDINIIGGGCLGLPMALAFSLKGHKVQIYDKNPERMSKDWFKEREKGPNGEDNFYELLNKANIKFVDLDNSLLCPFTSIDRSLNFILINTNNQKAHGNYINNIRYSYETEHIRNFFHEYKENFRERTKSGWWSKDNPVTEKELDRLYKDHMLFKIFVVGSTLTPGQTREIQKEFPELNLIYSPNLPAMGQVLQDVYNPEFAICGADEGQGDAVRKLKHFYSTIHNKEVFVTDRNSAELIKVAYNAYISSKIAYTSTLMEVSEKLDCNIDDVMACLKKGTDRLISTKYMSPGLPDAGPCHPSGLSALAKLGNDLDLSFNYFEHMLKSREDQLSWMAGLAVGELRHVQNKDIIILGKSFKAESNLTEGSCSTLLENILKFTYRVNSRVYDPYIYEYCTTLPIISSVFFLATPHSILKNLVFPKGSVVFDPWGIIPENKDYKVRKIGRKGSKKWLDR